MILCLIMNVKDGIVSILTMLYTPPLHPSPPGPSTWPVGPVPSKHTSVVGSTSPGPAHPAHPAIPQLRQTGPPGPQSRGPVSQCPSAPLLWWPSDLPVTTYLTSTMPSRPPPAPGPAGPPTGNPPGAAPKRPDARHYSLV
jgi:hypothetical protein